MNQGREGVHLRTILKPRVKIKTTLSQTTQLTHVREINREDTEHTEIKQDPRRGKAKHPRDHKPHGAHPQNHHKTGTTRNTAAHGTKQNSGRTVAEQYQNSIKQSLKNKPKQKTKQKNTQTNENPRQGRGSKPNHAHGQEKQADDGSGG